MRTGSFQQAKRKGGGEGSPRDGGRVGLMHWIGVSGILHGFILIVFLLAPHTPFSRTVSYPVYSVDLVGGEKLGGSGTPPAVPRQPVKEKRPTQTIEQPPPASEKDPVQAVKPAPPVKEKKPDQVLEEAPPASEKDPVPAITKEQRTEPETPPKIDEKPDPRTAQVKTLKRATPPRTVLAKKPSPADEERSRSSSPKAPALDPKHDAAGQENLNADKKAPGQGVREKLIQSAVDRVRQRVRTSEEESQSADHGVHSGTGDTEGAAVRGEGGHGGGSLKGMEFLVYRNRIFDLIKQRWTWAGRNIELQVTVRFGVQENGDIVGLNVVEGSGDSSFDESVLRAMRKATPLPPPPERHRTDFMNVVLTFRPEDLRG